VHDYSLLLLELTVGLQLWVRGIPTFGVMNIVPLFRRLVVVATGSGIGPCTTAILEKRVPMKVLWTAPNVRGTFGDKLVDQILGAAPDAVIYGTYRQASTQQSEINFYSYIRYSRAWKARHGQAHVPPGKGV
jgi:hypothetical protein